MRPINAKTSAFQYSQLLHQPNTRTIQLKDLSEEETEQLIATLLKLKKVPEKMWKEIHEKGQGNPFLTEEIVYALRDSGVLQVLPQNG